MNLSKSLLGLPIETWIINVGLFIFSALSPLIVASILNMTEELNDE